MNWSTDYPTKPGFYWIKSLELIPTATPLPFKLEGAIVAVVTNVQWPDRSERLEFRTHYTDKWYRRSDLVSAEWQGPIEPEVERCKIPAITRHYELFPETVCADCLERGNTFTYWPLSEVDGKPRFGMICRECWIKRLTPEQRKVYMV